MKYKVGDLVLYRPRPAYGDQEEGIGVIYKYDPYRHDGSFAVWWTNHCTKTDAEWYDKEELRLVSHESR